MFRSCHFCNAPEHAGSSTIQPCSELIYGTRPPLQPRMQASHPLQLLGLVAADDMTDSYVRMPADCMINPWTYPYDKTVNPLCKRWTDNSGCLKQYNSCGQQATYRNGHNGSDARKQAFFGGSWPPDCSTQHRFCTKWPWNNPWCVFTWHRGVMVLLTAFHPEIPAATTLLRLNNESFPFPTVTIKLVQNMLKRWLDGIHLKVLTTLAGLFQKLWNLTSMPFLEATTTSFVLLLPLVMTHMYQAVFSDKRKGMSVFSTSQPTIHCRAYDSLLALQLQLHSFDIWRDNKDVYY